MVNISRNRFPAINTINMVMLRNRIATANVHEPIQAWNVTRKLQNTQESRILFAPYICMAGLKTGIYFPNRHFLIQNQQLEQQNNA